MKKIYMKPVMRSVELDNEALIANSPAYQRMNYGGADSGQGTAESKRRSLWDDDEW